MSNLWEKAWAHILAARRCAQALVLCQVPLSRHAPRTQVQNSCDYKHQAVLQVLSKRPQSHEVLAKTCLDLWDLHGAGLVLGWTMWAPTRSCTDVLPPLCFAGPVRPPRSHLSLHFSGCISILLILTALTAICVCPHSKNRETFHLTSSLLQLLSFGLDRNNLKHNRCSRFHCYPSLCIPPQAFLSPAILYVAFGFTASLQTFSYLQSYQGAGNLLSGSQPLVPEYLLHYS